MLGMGNNSLASGSAANRTALHQPIAKPSTVPGINAIRKEAKSRANVIVAWTHNSRPRPKPRSVCRILVGGGKNAARRKPPWTNASHVPRTTSMVAKGIVNSRTAQENKEYSCVSSISKLEYRNPKQIRKLKIQITKSATSSFRTLCHWSFEKLFRISDFVLRDFVLSSWRFRNHRQLYLVFKRL